LGHDEKQGKAPTAEAEVEAIERTVFIAAPREIVFDFLLKPELLARWIGRSSAQAPGPGVAFHLKFVESGYAARGVYREISRPDRVSFTWGWDGNDDFPPGVSLVEIELVPQTGGTLLRLRHSGLPKAARDEFSSDGHSKRWDQYLVRLRSVASAP